MKLRASEPYFWYFWSSVALVPGFGPLDGPIYKFGKELEDQTQSSIGGALRWSSSVYQNPRRGRIGG